MCTVMTMDRSGRGVVVNFDLGEQFSVARSRVWGQFGPENKLIEGQPNEYDVICRNASVLAFHLWPTIGRSSGGAETCAV